MAEVLNTLMDRVSFKAPQTMSGPNVHRLKTEIMDFLKEDPKVVVIDFSGVDYIDLHGLILFKDLCEIIKVCGGQTYAYRLNQDVRNLLAEVDMLAEPGREQLVEQALIGV
ncbi:MAG TPA: STAS domain-containing protein [archaeon]|nr:STAS domain-containing protein [archaeon]